MLPRLFVGAATLSLICLVLTHERRCARVRRSYLLQDPETAFDVVSDVISLEYDLFGVESKLELRGNVASVRTSRRGHDALDLALRGTGRRISVPAIA